jgi:4-amino-4-deoxy-L-arabinose transferase-like glycosyltransferase
VIQAAGAVITDPLLILATTATMVWFWDAMMTDSKMAAWLMWMALAVGLLAKGPVAPVLCGLACGAWVMFYGRWSQLTSRAHILAGLVLMLAISAPWYYLAEHKTPGFLKYFIVGEHLDRYLVPAWTGDKYGGDKRQPFGTIWLYFIVGALPWSLIALARLSSAKTRATLREQYRRAPLMTGYLLCWTVMPLLFFTFARNILITYVMPVIPAMAILVSAHLETLAIPRKYLYTFACATTMVFFGGLWVAWCLHYDNHRYNQKPIIEAYKRLARQDPGPLIYTGAYRFSAAFYTDGQVTFTARPQSYFTDGTFYIAVRDMWQSGTSRHLRPRCRVMLHHSEFYLWYCPAITR